jgi:hypothetical protein
MIFGSWAGFANSMTSERTQLPYGSDPLIADPDISVTPGISGSIEYFTVLNDNIEHLNSPSVFNAHFSTRILIYGYALELVKLFYA